MYVKDLMTSGVVLVTPSDSLAIAREKLRVHQIHHLIVAERGTVTGIVSYRDLIGKDDMELVADVMTTDVVTVEPWETVRVAATKMIGRAHGCLPVIEGGRVAGIVTSTDLIHAVSMHESQKSPAA